jgi:hypothetical protein
VHAEKVFAILYEVVVILFLVLFALKHNPVDTETSSAAIGLVFIKSVVLLYVICPLYAVFLQIYFGMIFIIFSIVLRMISYIFFVFTTPYYSEQILPEEY